MTYVKPRTTVPNSIAKAPSDICKPRVRDTDGLLLWTPSPWLYLKLQLWLKYLSNTNETPECFESNLKKYRHEGGRKTETLQIWFCWIREKGKRKERDKSV